MTKHKGSASRRSKTRKRQPPRRAPSRHARTRWAGIAVGASALALASWWLFLHDDKPDFSGERALELIVRQVEFGPRTPGSESHRRARAYLLETLRQYADRVGEQTFPYADRRDSTRTYEGANIIASFNLGPDVTRRVMLAAHWDSRPYADQDPDPANRTRPVPGANDGASGVAVLLELARLFHAEPPEVGVDLVFFDLEDLGDEAGHDGAADGAAGATTGGNPFAIGSEYFAEHYDHYRPTYGILLDMVCDRNLQIPRETHSLQYARPVVDKVWDAARRVGATAFVDRQGQAVLDDHAAFLRRGIRVIDLIQTPFPSYWHTTHDTPDQCSAESLQQVGDVLVEVVYDE